LKFAHGIPGSVHLYKKGRCGFHHRFGHIEVLVDAATGETCSDHCRLPDRSCRPDMVLVPVSSCEWLTLYQSLQTHVIRAFENSVNVFEKPYRVETWMEGLDPKLD